MYKYLGIGGIKLKDEYVNSLRELDYASLSDMQEKRLRELEKKFNDEFGTDYYFLTMKREN